MLFEWFVGYADHGLQIDTFQTNLKVQSLCLSYKSETYYGIL